MKFVNEDKVIALFGYWPQFCDAKLLKLNFDFINMGVEMIIHYIDSDKNIQSKIKLYFSQVSEFGIHDIMEDNVFDELSIKPITSHSIQVRLDSCYGLNGSFRCKSAEVLDVSQ
jgi:hypothetical protein